VYTVMPSSPFLELRQNSYNINLITSTIVQGGIQWLLVHAREHTTTTSTSFHLYRMSHKQKQKLCGLSCLAPLPVITFQGPLFLFMAK
jgi:hypothetical protein